MGISNDMSPKACSSSGSSLGTGVGSFFTFCTGGANRGGCVTGGGDSRGSGIGNAEGVNDLDIDDTGKGCGDGAGSLGIGAGDGAGSLGIGAGDGSLGIGASDGVGSLEKGAVDVVPLFSISLQAGWR